MAWTDIARRERRREGLRYPSDMTDREWTLSAPFIPSAKGGSRRRTTDMREVVNAILYMAASGCAWRTAAQMLSASLDGAGVISTPGATPICSMILTRRWS